MVQAILNPVFVGLRGQMGELVFKRYGERVVVTRKPDMSGVVWSEAQQKGRNRFRQAAQYARLAVADPVLKARYSAAGMRRGAPAYRVALADALNPPVVEAVDLGGYHGQPGEAIRVWAQDDFEVVRVQVAIARLDGTLVDAGDAVQEPSGRWTYTAGSALPEGEWRRVTVTAYDRAGNRAVREDLAEVNVRREALPR